MKRTLFFAAALVPFVATAGQGMNAQSIDHGELRQDLQVTEILGSDVRDANDQEVGAIEDVIFDSNGKIVSVLIQAEGGLDIGRDADRAAGSIERGAERTGEEVEEGWNEVTGQEEDADVSETRTREDRNARDGMDVAVDPDRAGTTEMGDDFIEVQWSDISYDKAEQLTRLQTDLGSLQTVSYDQSGELQMEGEIRASKLVGLEVDLSDEESFGEVEDVLVNSDKGKASALVVDSMEFFDKKRYALPVNLEGLNEEEETLSVQYSKQQIEEMGEFEMEAEEEDTSERM